MSRSPFSAFGNMVNDAKKTDPIQTLGTISPVKFWADFASQHENIEVITVNYFIMLNRNFDA